VKLPLDVFVLAHWGFVSRVFQWRSQSLRTSSQHVWRCCTNC